MREWTRSIAKELKVVGLMNIQYAVKDDELYIIEANPRASRTVPFVAKAIGHPIVKYASLLMFGKTLADIGFTEEPILTEHVAVKEVVLPFDKFPGADTLLGPEMRSTGEVMGIDATFNGAYAKVSCALLLPQFSIAVPIPLRNQSLRYTILPEFFNFQASLAAGMRLPKEGTVFISVREQDKQAMVPIAKELVELGYKIMATSGTGKVLKAAGVDSKQIFKIQVSRIPYV